MFMKLPPLVRVESSSPSDSIRDEDSTKTRRRLDEGRSFTNANTKKHLNKTTHLQLNNPQQKMCSLSIEARAASSASVTHGLLFIVIEPTGVGGGSLSTASVTAARCRCH
jgi:hypothetical protein